MANKKRATQPLQFFIVKVHSLCNLNCDYCYEYNLGNDGWKFKPKRMEMETFEKLCRRILEHARIHDLDDVFLSFHGGEPTYRPPEFFDEAMTRAKKILGSDIEHIGFGLQSNATRMTEDYIDVFLKHGLHAGTSIDGPRQTNDRHRVDHQGRSSFEKVLEGISHFQTKKGKKAWGGILSVIDAKNDPLEVFRFLSHLEPPSIDFLEPDGHWDRLPHGKAAPDSREYGEWLIRLFDFWFKSDDQIIIRRFEEIIEHLCGGAGTTEYFGIEPANLITIATDGSYEAVDQIKGAYNGAENLGLNVFENSLDEVMHHPTVQMRLIGKDALSEECKECEFLLSCGGGYFPHRYKKDNGFKNPSVYCADYKALFSHISHALEQELRQ